MEYESQSEFEGLIFLVGFMKKKERKEIKNLPLQLSV
jgi:hypothetical protein